MVLRCSLLGHDYGEPDVEREREERGSEVVVTVQEYEECSRCGERHVISENTEVTSLSADAAGDVPDDVAPSTDASPDTNSQSAPDADPAADSDPEPAAETPAGTDAEFIDADADGGDAGAADASQPAAEGADASTSTTSSANARADGETGDGETGVETDSAADDGTDGLPTDENGDPITDDGEILEETVDEPTDRGRGEWPEMDDVGPPVGTDEDPTDWPNADEIEDGPVEDDAVVLEHDSGSVADAVGTTEDPESVADEIDASVHEGVDVEPGADVAPAEESTSDPDTGIERANAAPVPAEDTGPADDAPMEFYCPRCDYVAADDRGSLRAGDICPECRKGYLGERPRR